jgi:uncharacterized membrane protein (UPF0127 family)
VPRNRKRGRGRIRVEAPADVDPLEIAQAIVGPHILLKAEQNTAHKANPFDRWQAMFELYEAVIKLYERRLAHMIADLEAYVHRELGSEDEVYIAAPFVSTAAELEQGLRGAPKGASLVLAFPSEDAHVINMEGMKYALDLMFVDRNHKVLAVRRGWPGKKHVITGPKRTKYVVEVPAGAAGNVTRGTRVTWGDKLSKSKAELQHEHGGTLQKIEALRERRDKESVFAFLDHVLGWLPKHFAQERREGVEGCDCGEHDTLLRDASRVRGLDGALKLAKKIETHIAREERAWGSLKKAAPKGSLFSPSQLEEMAQIIRDHHAAFVREFGGANTKGEIARLIKEGKLPPEAMTAVFDAFTYGQLVATLRAMDDREKAKKLAWGSFKARSRRRPPPLSAREKEAIEWAKHSAAVHIRGLGNVIADDFSTMAIEADADLRRRYVNVIQEEVATAIEQRKSWQTVVSGVGHRTGDWARDLGRIVATELQRATQQGFANGLIKREKTHPKNIRVAKRPQHTACPDCIRLHLTNGPGSAPKIFRLSTLIGNGSNIGRKRRSWKAVVGTVHPWCACELVHVPPGWGFEKTPPKGQGWDRFSPGAYRRKHKDGSMEFWTASMVPDTMRRGLALSCDLMKATMTYGNVPEVGCSIRIGDPSMRMAVEKVLATAPEAIFTKKTGVTLITTDIPRAQVALEDHDLAYWTGNEIRLSQTLPIEKVGKVLRHELGHVPNVYLIRKWGGEKPVRAWHNALYMIAADEGFVSKYASKLPIECAAEATRMYLFDRKNLMLRYPKQFAFLHDAYRDLLREGPGRSAQSLKEAAE